MNPTPTILTIPSKKLIGMRMKMSMAQNKTGELWRSFGQRRKEISNSIGPELYSMQIYPPGHFANFNPTAEFEKWATIEVTDFNTVPQGMETFTLPGGLYAVFHYVGTPAAAAPFFQHIFGTWLPASEYELDDRPHFEILGEKYKNGDPASEEDVYIPIKPKA